ncbi:hypothetical protein GCM10010343_46750 [Streptomyces avidinii]|nr:hypothetical protein GCM10010343_46750 [Streptomyces avidinii]
MPASEGNNDWNRDRIPTLLPLSRDLAVSCPARAASATEPEYHESSKERRSGPVRRRIPEAHVGLYLHHTSETAVTIDTTPFTPEERRSRPHSTPEDGLHGLPVAWTDDRTPE